MFAFFARPKNFRALARIATPLCAAFSAVLLPLGLYYALCASPPDYQQGETVRIMYVHVPAAWCGLAIYAAMALAAAAAFIWKHTLADLFCRAAAPIGATFTALCLATGSLWGQPMWGTWWVWDARLTSMLLLLFLYLGYLALRGAFEDDARGAKAAQLLLVAGALNLPVIKFSVNWWHTLHQGETVFRAHALDPAMRLPLLTLALGFTAFAGLLVLLRMTSLLRKVAHRDARQTPI